MSPLLQRVLLAVFVVVDIFLIVGAIRHVNSTPPSTDLPAAAPAGATPPPATSATPESEPATQLAYNFEAAEAVSLSVANDGTIVYGTRGRCSDPEARVQVSTNGGAEFDPAKTGLTTVLAVRAASKTSIAIVGTTADCQVKQLNSSDAGSSWTESGKVELWYPGVNQTTTVVTSRGQSKPGEGCVVTSISQVTAEQGRVSCADGSFWGSGDSGKTWVQLGRLDNARVATFLTPSAGFALARYNGCAANAFTTNDGGVTWTPGGCISGDPARAIAATASRLVAVVDEDVYTSDNTGTVWKQP
ncbi:WD40/YVTN/BNR-like repeat-containing protein [Aeromicrobium wangtongii]|uniref:Exo-alpha-sialidase n=1 Tax=Aeromicrobium wangtongii TaxID=2969247 RepID=A0ABY5M9K9_9ACTN|nr:hypothetical protein [Aeromicrobium wangtongii]MCD9199478.1 hypothetical protein [Aeromicrobium wangtongii]UUP13831.1 hypothetical protein NQV15_00535 [Aeromicrobium wangtongii]